MHGTVCTVILKNCEKFFFLRKKVISVMMTKSQIFSTRKYYVFSKGGDHLQIYASYIRPTWVIIRPQNNNINKHRWASPSISMSAISDIWHRHLLFRYRRQICRTEKRRSDIGSVPISTSEFIPISDIEEKNYFSLQIPTRAPWNGKRALYHCATLPVC